MIFVHLYDDFSGSPRVLRETITALSNNDNNVLFVSNAREGVLKKVEVDKKYFFYRRSNFRWLSLFFYLLSQCSLFFQMSCSKRARSSPCVFVNTILPFGALIFAKVFGKRAVVHVHESPYTSVLYRFVFSLFVSRMAHQLIFVSNWQKNAWNADQLKGVVLSNPLPTEFSVLRRRKKDRTKFKVLMPCYNRNYKGVDTFIKLATELRREKIDWILLLNEKKAIVDRVRDEVSLVCEKISVVEGLSDPSHFYLSSSLVLNLSKPQEFVETFGMTVIEAFSSGCPVIAPFVGGPVELIEDGITGYLVDTNSIDRVKERVLELLNNDTVYEKMSLSAWRASRLYTADKFCENVRQICSEGCSKGGNTV